MDTTERKKIGILLVSDDVGVVYYLLSITKSLEYLDDATKPQVCLFYDDSCEKYVSMFTYVYLDKIHIEYKKNSLLKYLFSMITRQNLFIKTLLIKYDLKGLFPVMDLPVKYTVPSKVIASWIPDFQHKFYSHFFTKKNLLLRETRFKQIVNNCDTVVLSSQDAYSHFKVFYNTKVKVQILPFVSMIENFPTTSMDELIIKYKIIHPYFVLSNQFYAHKNHIVVFKAIKRLKDEGLNFLVYFTGKTEDYRDPLFFGTLAKFIKDNQIEEQVRILGLVSREDQLGLVKGASAIIQPSKFEGWNSTIEDAKTLQQQVICSDLKVHIEQMSFNAFYFAPDDELALASIMKQFIQNKEATKPVFTNYSERISQFANSFVSIFN